MIFGKSYEEKQRIVRGRVVELRKATCVFAWYPVRLTTGVWVWLQDVLVSYPRAYAVFNTVYKDKPQYTLTNVRNS